MALVIAATRPEQHALATPCTEWDVHALLAQVTGGPHLFAAMARGRAGGSVRAAARPGIPAAPANTAAMTQQPAAFMANSQR